jgi:hypothetical protein
MSSFDEKIDIFLNKKYANFKQPLKKIVDKMIEQCRYINEESLERHNWGSLPKKLENIPHKDDIHHHSYEEQLLKALDKQENEQSIIELLWGDIQLGKRVHACIIMWISVYILKRPVLYIFRNLEIDQKQLKDDIMGTDEYNFNIQFIKKIFEEFNSELQEYFKEDNNTNYWRDFKLPELRDIKTDNIIDRLSNKEAINANDIFCCLMNESQLDKVNKQFTEYIYKNNELVNMTVLVDESDLMSSTASNDKSDINDFKDTSKCEKLLAKIYKKVKYVLHITGTAHSLLYNITTKLTNHYDIQIKISKVHKMKRSSDYYGLFNKNSIAFNTTLVKTWWKDQSKPDDEDNKKPSKYDIIQDYQINIKKVINEVVNRTTTRYNSLIISEEKIKINQTLLVNEIMQDFPDLFIIKFNGDNLKLYLSKEYQSEAKYLAQWDKNQSSSSRLYQINGLHSLALDIEEAKKLPNNYCYFNIDTKTMNIKMVYKLLRILFEKSRILIKNKTVITITGKYAERGYSFTSDDYGEYSFHLTDQYFVSHATFNCTDISQRLRLQGKYNDTELKNGKMKLTLWTTPELQDVIQNFYVKFINKIEENIMDCQNWYDIKNLMEDIIDNGELKLRKYMQYLDVRKKRKNIKIKKSFDPKNNGYKLIDISDMSEEEISQWCKDKKLPDYICINEIKNDLTIAEFIDKYYNYKPIVPIKIPKSDLNIENKTETFDYIKNIFKDCIKHSVYRPTTINMNRKNGINNAILNNKPYNYSRGKPNECIVINYNDDDYYHIVGLTNQKDLPTPTNDYLKKTPYIINGDKVKYTVINDKFKQLIKQNNKQEYTNEDDDTFIENDTGLPDTYYWKTPNEWLYLFKKNKEDIIFLEIVAPSNDTSQPEPKDETEPKSKSKTNTTTKKKKTKDEVPIDDDVLNTDLVLFTNTCLKIPDKENIRTGIISIYNLYKDWSKKNDKKCFKTFKIFKDNFDKLGFKEETSKGVDSINNKPGKRGYKLIVMI